MNELPVSKSVSKLEVFSAQKGQLLWVNKIVDLVNKKTGSKDKPAIIKMIDYLEQAAILESHLANKQKTIKKLRPLGHEILRLIHDLDDFHYNYSKLKNLIIQYNFKVGAGKTKRDIQMRKRILKNKLLYSGFSKDEIESFDDMIKSAFQMESLYRKNIFSCILHRYSNILSRHTPNDKATEILVNIMTKAILKIFSLTKELNSVFDNPEVYLGSGQEDDRGDLRVDLAPYMTTDTSVLADFEDLCYDGGLGLYRKDLAEIVHDLTLSTLMVLQPDEDGILGFLEAQDDSEYSPEELEEWKRSLNEETYYFELPMLYKIYKKYSWEMKLDNSPANLSSLDLSSPESD